MAYFGENAIFAWANLDSSMSPRDSFNISSTEDVSESLAKLTFSTAYGSANYCICGFAGYNSYDQNNFVSSPSNSSISNWMTSTFFRIHAVYANNSHNRDPDVFTVVIVGDN